MLSVSSRQEDAETVHQNYGAYLVCLVSLVCLLTQD